MLTKVHDAIWHHLTTKSQNKIDKTCQHFEVHVAGARLGISINFHLSHIQNLTFLAATKQLYEWYFPSVRPSVCLLHLFTPQPKLGSKGIVVIRRAGGRAWPQHRYRSHGRSSYPIAVKLGRDEPWGRTSDEFVLGRRGSLIKRLMS